MIGPVIAALALAVAVLTRRPTCRRIAPAARRGGRGYPIAAFATIAAGVVLVAARPAPTTVLAVAVLVLTAAIRYRRRRRMRRDLLEAQQLEAALDVLIGELRVGAHPVRALSVAAAETAETGVGTVLAAVAARARLGADVPAGLRSAGARSAMAAQWERLAMCWRLADEHGLAIAALLRAAQRDLTEQQRFWGRISAGMAGARATAAILAGLPVLGVLMGELIGAAPVGFLLGGHLGGWLLVIGVSLSCVGLWWSDRITDRVTT